MFFSFLHSCNLYFCYHSDRIFVFRFLCLSTFYQCLVTGNNEACWELVWGLCEQLDSIDPDKAFMVNLREFRSIFTGELLDLGVQR